jgi:hypothetical protein
MNPREPTLDELLGELIIRQMMASDGVRDEDIRRLMHDLKSPPSREGRAGLSDHIDQLSAA